MSNWTVQDRITGEVVYAYTADAAVDWPEYPFANFNHTAQPEAVVTASRRVTKLEFVGRLGVDYTPLLSASKQSVEIEAFMKMIDWATPEADGTSLDLEDARIVAALARLEQVGAIAAGRAAEILG